MLNASKSAVDRQNKVMILVWEIYLILWFDLVFFDLCTLYVVSVSQFLFGDYGPDYVPGP